MSCSKSTFSLILGYLPNETDSNRESCSWGKQGIGLGFETFNSQVPATTLPKSSLLHSLLFLHMASFSTNVSFYWYTGTEIIEAFCVHTCLLCPEYKAYDIRGLSRK